MTGSLEDRSRIDPEGRYPSQCLRLVEKRAQEVLDCLPGSTLERTRDVIQIDSGNERGIVVLVTTEALEIRLPTVEWTCGSHGPTRSSELWKRIDGDLDGVSLLELLIEAQQARLEQFRECQYCGERVPPEHRFDANTCHGCASREHGIVY